MPEPQLAKTSRFGNFTLRVVTTVMIVTAFIIFIVVGAVTKCPTEERINPDGEAYTEYCYINYWDFLSLSAVR
jgi:large-conductance mechanosensitive channel